MYTYNVPSQVKETSYKLTDIVVHTYQRCGIFTDAQNFHNKKGYYDIVYGNYKGKKIQTKIIYLVDYRKVIKTPGKHNASVVYVGVSGGLGLQKEFILEIFRSIYLDAYNDYENNKLTDEQLVVSLNVLEQYLEDVYGEDTQKICDEVVQKTGHISRKIEAGKPTTISPYEEEYPESEKRKFRPKKETLTKEEQPLSKQKSKEGENKTSPIEEKKESIEFPDYEEALNQAKDKNSSEAALARLARSTRWEIREAVAKNKNASLSTIKKLSKDPNKNVRTAVALRDDLPSDLRKELVDDLWHFYKE